MTYPRPVRPRSLSLALLAIVGTGCSSTSGPSGSGSTSNSDTASDAAGDAANGCGTALIGVDASQTELDMCFPDHDGINGGTYPIDLTVDDTGFSKTVIGTQNDATAVLTLKNTGTKPHGFEVECTSVVPAYPTVPAGCPSVACFPSNSIIGPLAPGESQTITFFTPTPDGLNYPVKSSEPSDCAVPGLNGSITQWALM
jgi:hypothetical protein